jgi:hypothetical protein
MRSHLTPSPTDIDVAVYYPSSIQSPGFDAENKTKPLVTKEIEGAAAIMSPQEVRHRIVIT